MARKVKTLLIAYKTCVQTALSKEQYERLTVLVEELSDLMFGQLGELRKYLGKTLQGELDEFFDQKIPELIELKQSLTKVLIVDETEAEGMKFSKEVYKQCTTDYVEQCKDEVTNNCTREDVEQCRDEFMEAEVASYQPDKSEEIKSVPREV